MPRNTGSSPKAITIKTASSVGTSYTEIAEFTADNDVMAVTLKNTGSVALSGLRIRGRAINADDPAVANLVNLDDIEFAPLVDSDDGDFAAGLNDFVRANKGSAQALAAGSVSLLVIFLPAGQWKLEGKTASSTTSVTAAF